MMWCSLLVTVTCGGPPTIQDYYYGPGECLHGDDSNTYDTHREEYDEVSDPDGDTIDFTPGDAELQELGSQQMVSSDQSSTRAYYAARCCGRDPEGKNKTPPV